MSGRKFPLFDCWEVFALGPSPDIGNWIGSVRSSGYESSSWLTYRYVNRSAVWLMNKSDVPCSCNRRIVCVTTSIDQWQLSVSKTSRRTRQLVFPFSEHSFQLSPNPTIEQGLIFEFQKFPAFLCLVEVLQQFAASHLPSDVNLRTLVQLYHLPYCWISR